MAEHPLQNSFASPEPAKFKQGKISSKIFDGTAEELYYRYVCYRQLYELGKLVASETHID
jgi:hypothetical protein